ncbi:MAG: SusC/RagA family TonB-linked outer membrane protein [Candidatus Azobacteroides sp.]|nr:SusC/RagA family TonB-linked outer membrane protein [Candidatus Azobacteroides sp.]
MIQKPGNTKRKLALMLFLFTVCHALSAQTRTVSGTVTDSEDYPLIGVSVAVKGTTQGSITDIDGRYTLPNVNNNDILLFTYVGYEAKEVAVGNQSEINVIMSESSIDLGQEVVVIGYGTQKKVNLTGAVSSVKVDESISGRSIANVSTALQGLVPGLAVTQKSGMAGNNSSELIIRGIGTINDANPLIVVDDMPDVDINRLNLDDIESISVLKDATAASVYGSRAANGVILIKTKSGKGLNKTNITFSGSYGWEKPIRSYNFLTDYAQALEIHRAAQAATNMAESAQQYQKGTIDQWMALGMIDEKRYPNTDWWDIIMRTGSIQNYNVSATGGNEVSNFYASIGYLKQEGLQINNDYDRYNARFNFDYKLFKNLTTGMRMDGNWSNFQYALANGFTSTGENYNMDMQSAIAGVYPYDPELGVYGGVMAAGENSTAFNPLEYFTNHLKKQDRQELNGSFYLEWEPLKGLTARVDYNLRYYNQFEKQADMPNQAYNFQTDDFIPDKWYVSENAGVTDKSWTGYKTLMNARLNYNTNITKDHNLGLLFVYSEEYWYDRYLSGTRENRVHPNLSELDAALTETVYNSGNSSTEGLRSYIGRINYAAFDKYLLELNFRVDGSSKFQPGHQYGFFPSASLGWRFSEENFIQPYIENFMTNGKLRFSYGSLGNNFGIGRTEQQEVLKTNNYILDGGIVNGFVYRKMLNPDLTWEKTTIFNAGLDVAFFHNRLSAELDYYDRLTTGMIQQSQMSIHLTGAYEAPRANIGNLRNRGLEGNFTWRDKISDFNYSVNFNISYNASRLEK